MAPSYRATKFGWIWRKGETYNLAHITETVGKWAESVARTALMANGWTVATTETDESFDVVARDPLTKDWKTFQVKKIRQRSDRNNELVVYARRNDGSPYRRSDADYFIGVMGVDGAAPRTFMFENRELSEYWASESRAAERWVELPLEMNIDSEAV